MEFEKKAAGRLLFLCVEKDVPMTLSPAFK